LNTKSQNKKNNSIHWFRPFERPTGLAPTSKASQKIEKYAARHSSIPPGYKNDNPQNPPTSLDFCQQLVVQGRYISEMPQNPFNKRQDIRMIGNSETFPQNPTNQFGWVYQPATKTIRLDWSGADKDGIRYYDY
jgi:hypothetical protein